MRKWAMHLTRGETVYVHGEPARVAANYRNIYRNTERDVWIEWPAGGRITWRVPIDHEVDVEESDDDDRS